MKNYFLHKSCFVDENVSIGNGTKIWHFSHISKNAKIGKNVIIGQNIFVGEGVNIGDNCKIFPGAVISAVSQDLKYKGEYTTTEIGNNTTIREFVTIHKGTTDRHKTIVGSNCTKHIKQTAMT